MADEENPGQDYEANGTTYRIPKLTDTADAVVAFTDYSNSIPFSEYIQTEDVSGAVTVDDSYNGKMIVAKGDTVLTFGNLTNGFSVACVADGDHIISYEGVDKENQQTQAYEVATVVTVNDRNILSVARAQSDNIIIDQGPAEGTPPAPILVDKDGNEDASGGSVIYFTPGAPNTEQAPALLFSAKIRRQDNADLTTETVTVDQDNMEINVAGTEPFVDYVVDVYGINEEGKGETASTSAFQLNYNNATGGDVVDEYTRLSDNTRWRYHAFYGGSSYTLKQFTVGDAPKTFRVLWQGAGGPGGYCNTSVHGAASAPSGGAGRFVEDDSVTIEKGTYDIEVGHSVNSGMAKAIDTKAFGQTAPGGGQGGQAGGGAGSAGGSGGGGGGSHGVGGSGGSEMEGSPRPGVGAAGQTAPNNGMQHRDGGNAAGTTGPTGYAENDITGVLTQYGKGGSSGGGAAAPTIVGQGGNGGNDKRGFGGEGALIVAYEIGTSTTRQIQQAEAQAAARQAGVEQGIEQGYSQAQQDLQEELTSLRTQLSAVGTTDV